MTQCIILISRITTDFFLQWDLLPICGIWQRWLDLVECSGRDFEHTCMNDEKQNEKHNLKTKNLDLRQVWILLLNFRLAGLRELGKYVFFCGVPKVPCFGTVKVLMNAFMKSLWYINIKHLVSCLFFHVPGKNPI